MSTLESIFSRAANYVQTIGIADVVDILIVAFLIFKLIQLIRKTNSYNLAKGLLLFLVVLWLSEVLRLTMISFILRKATEIGVVFLVVLFQPELRHILEKIGSRLTSRSNVADPEVTSAISQTVMACAEMAESRTGALIIFERYVSLQSIIATGTVIDAEVSSELLKNIFYNKAPLHDGAVIVRDGRIAAAGCVLPLSSSMNISKDLGMRHRAGIGMSEQSRLQACFALLRISAHPLKSCRTNHQSNRRFVNSSFVRLYVLAYRRTFQQVFGNQTQQISL